MFQQLLARISEDDNPRLRRIPFLAIWIGSYAIAWTVVFGVFILFEDLTIHPKISEWYYYSPEWQRGVVTGLILGLVLSMSQAWIIRRRYGFVPKFWRLATLIGCIIAGLAMPTISPTFNWYSDSIWINTTFWVMSIPLAQSFALFSINRRAWLLSIFAVIIGLFAGSLSYSDYNIDGNLGLLYGVILQVLGSGLIIMYLMASPRKSNPLKREIIPISQTKLHPITFIAFWTISHYSGWMIAMICLGLIAYLGIVQITVEWLININAEWVFMLLLGCVIGIVSSVSKKWLIKQQSGVDMRHWIALSTIGWAIGSIPMWQFMSGDSEITVASLIALTVWFTVPTLFQTTSIWYHFRGGWLWLGTGIVTTIITSLIVTQMAWEYSPIFSGMIFGGIVYGIITASTFLLLYSQKRQADIAAME